MAQGRSKRLGGVFAASVVVHTVALTALILLVPDLNPWTPSAPATVLSSLDAPPPIADEPPPEDPEEIPDDAERPTDATTRMVSEVDEPSPAERDADPIDRTPISVPGRADLTARIGRPRPRRPESESVSYAPPVVREPAPKVVVRPPVRTKAKLLTRGRPRFHGSAGGEVLLRVEVRPDGRSGKITVVETKGSARLERIAVSWARGLRFEPATVDGRAVKSTVPIRVQF